MQADSSPTPTSESNAEELFDACYKKDVEKLRELIRAGSNVEATNKYGVAPLHIAAKVGCTGCVDVLIKAGANVNSLVDSWKYASSSGSTVPEDYDNYEHGSREVLHNTNHKKKGGTVEAVCTGDAESASSTKSTENELGDLAYDAIRLVVLPWMRERRLRLEEERARLARSIPRTIAGGAYHSLALRRDGGVACWGCNDYGQAPPKGVSGDFVAIATGYYHSLALRRDGGVTCWGRNDHGEAPPKGVSGDFVAIAAGWDYSLALRRDGGVACWGYNHKGQAPPDGVSGDFVAIAAGYSHSLALRRDGSVACWGDNFYDQAPPDGVSGDFVAIAAGYSHSLALRRDGSVACWGRNFRGQAPPDGASGDFVTAGWNHSVALRRNGSVACWGRNRDGQAPLEGMSGDFVAIGF